MKEKYNINILGWKVDPQEDFLADGSRNNYVGKLAIPDGMKVAPAIGKVQATLEDKGVRIFGSMDWHLEEKQNDYSVEFSDAPDFINTFPPHCIRGTYGAQYIREARGSNPLYLDWYPLENDMVHPEDFAEAALHHDGEVIFRKDRFDVFDKKGNWLTDIVVATLKENGFKAAVVYGVATEVCNNYAVNGLLERGIEVYAVTDAMRAIDETKKDEVFTSWQVKGAKLIRISELESIIDLYKNIKE